MNTLRLSRWALAGIAAVAASVSYWTQRNLLLDHDADQVSAYAIPLTVDLAVIVCSLVINSLDIDPEARRLAWIVLSTACAVSIAANYYAGDNPIQRIAHVWCVLIYLGTEAVASRARMRRTPAPVRRQRRPVAKPAPEPTELAVVGSPRKPRATGPRGRTKVTSLKEIEASKSPELVAV